jgi:PIN domain nuclease of toxin-antitoxin system
MVRTRSVCLDTHVVIWLAGGLANKIDKASHELINNADVIISSAVTLELQFLFEIGRISVSAVDVLRVLEDALALREAPESFHDVAHAALSESWTRDPFDRLIVAHARLLGAPLISHDRQIAAAYAETRR